MRRRTRHPLVRKALAAYAGAFGDAAANLRSGDGLYRFLVDELTDVVPPSMGDAEAAAEIVRVTRQAITDLEAVASAIGA